MNPLQRFDCTNNSTWWQVLEKEGYGFCSDWFHRRNDNPVKASKMEIINGLQYYCKNSITSIAPRLTRTTRF